MPPGPQYWTPPPQYQIPEDPPEDFRFEDLFTNPFPGAPGQGNPGWWNSPYGSEADRLQDFYLFNPTGDQVKSAAWNISDRASWDPMQAQAAYDAIQFAGSQHPGQPGQSFLEVPTLGVLEGMGFRPSHQYGEPVFYSLDKRGGLNGRFKLVRWENGVGTTIYEGDDQGQLNLAYQQIASQLGLDSMQLREFMRTGFVASYPYPEGNRQEVEGAEQAPYPVDEFTPAPGEGGPPVTGVSGTSDPGMMTPHDQGWLDDLENGPSPTRDQVRYGHDWWGGQESPIAGFADMGQQQSNQRDMRPRTGTATTYRPGPGAMPIDQLAGQGPIDLSTVGYQKGPTSQTQIYYQGDEPPQSAPMSSWLTEDDIQRLRQLADMARMLPPAAPR